MSSLSSALSNHIAFHKLPSDKQGVLLYRKGSDVLASLHNVLYRERLRLKKLTETEGLHNLSLSLSEEALLFEAAMILSNLVMCQGESSLKPCTDKIDIAKISLASLIVETDSRLWNFVCLVTMNQTLWKKVKKQCGVDWSTRLDSCDESETLGERTSKILMVISLCLFICNSEASLMQLMISDITASYSGYCELNRIFNQLGITVSRETLNRYITAVVDVMSQNNMKESFVTDGFVITSVDNIDKGTPHAALSFGRNKYGLHGTSVQALQPKPQSIKNSYEDHVMFHRQPAVGNEDETLVPVRVYPDGCCLFRSVAIRLEHQLLICPRSNNGAPTDPSLFNLEKSLADALRERAVNTLKSNLTFFQQLDSGILHSLCEKEKGSFTRASLTSLKICLNMMNMLVYQK